MSGVKGHPHIEGDFHDAEDTSSTGHVGDHNVVQHKVKLQDISFGLSEVATECNKGWDGQSKGDWCYDIEGHIFDNQVLVHGCEESANYQ